MGDTALTKKMTFTAKDIIYLVLLISGGFTSWYAMDSRVLILELNDKSKDKKITILESENKAYKGLPSQVSNLEKTVKENAELTKAIYIGLVAKGIIKPKPIQ